VANADVATTTYTYDANGNVTQAGGWSYVWDYLNRMLASGYNNSTTTYAYDPSGARVLQTSTTSTTYYPFKYFSLASTTNGGTSWATSTNYIWLGDTLLGTIDQKLYNGTATGSAITRYVHPDHLGSTNVVTDASGTIAQLFDYYPYGATRVSSSTFPTNEKRQYIGQFSDAQTNLDYLQARYYDSARGQFISQDPTFWGNPKDEDLRNPQSLNSYSYANDNPIVNKDSNGSAATLIALLYAAVFLAIAVMALSSGSAASSGGGGGGNSIASNAVKAADQILTSAGHATVNGAKAITGAAVGTAMTMLVPMASPALTGVATPVIGGTAATTPSMIGSPYLINSPDAPIDTSIDLSSKGGGKGTPKPSDAPSGTKPIDKVGLSKDAVHQIKDIIGAAPNDWVGQAPNGDIITGTSNGETINHGPIQPY
jgi:RHS repeat-associated protein